MQNPTLQSTLDCASLPTISIVTPSFNHAEFVEATLVSVLEQGYPKLEYVVMDGGSTDGSTETIAKYEDHLAYWRSRPDEGPYHAINEGFKHTTGEIMAWLSSDDMLHRNSLWTVAELFGRFPQVQWLCGLPTAFDVQGRTTVVREPRKWSRYRFLAGDRTYIQQESVFWRRTLWEKTGSGLNTSFQYAADFELWMRFFRQAKLHTVTTLIGGFRRTPGQISERFLELYVDEVDRILADEPLRPGDELRVGVIRIFDRLVFRIPFLPTSQWIRQIYDRLNCTPPTIEYDQTLQEFRIRQLGFWET